MQSKSPKAQSGLSLLVLIFAALAVGAMAGAAIGGLWVFNNVDARIVLSDQPAQISLNKPLPVTARIQNKLDISLDEIIRTQVPISKVVSVPVDETLNLIASLKTTVPVNLNVRVRDTIAINQILDIDAVVVAKVLGETINIPIKGKVPVNAKVPIDLIIPVNESIEVDIVTPVKAVLKQNLDVPLDTVIDTEIPIRSDMSVPVSSDVIADVVIMQQPLDVIINYADLVIGLDTLRLGVTDEEAPQRRDENKND